jgi:hypothetical protein
MDRFFFYKNFDMSFVFFWAFINFLQLFEVAAIYEFEIKQKEML